MTVSGVIASGRWTRVTPYRIALIPGDGIGIEVIPRLQRVSGGSLGSAFTFELAGSGMGRVRATWHGAARCHAWTPCGNVTAHSSAQSVRRATVCQATPAPSSSCARGWTCTATFGLRCPAPVAGSRPGVDLLIVRENTE